MSAVPCTGVVATPQGRPRRRTSARPGRRHSLSGILGDPVSIVDRAPSVRPVLSLLASWVAVDLLFNVRYPGPEPAGWYLLPSIDAAVLLAACALAAAGRRRLPTAVVVALAVMVAIVRLFRFGDGLT